jgi:hypothetical protein
MKVYFDMTEAAMTVYCDVFNATVDKFERKISSLSPFISVQLHLLFLSFSIYVLFAQYIIVIKDSQ